MEIATGGPGDGTAGLTWLSWIDKGGPIPGFTHLVNAPFGETLRDPFQITSMFSITGMWIFKHLTGSSICAWNLMLLMGYMSSALAMFAFVRWLLKNTWVAFFGAFVVTFTPFHQMNAHGHLSYMFNFFFILVLWAFLVFWRNPTRRNILLLGLSTAACVYQDGYFILLVGVLLSGLIAGSFAVDAWITKQNKAYLLQRLKAVCAYVAIAVLFLAPVVLVQFVYASKITSTLASSRGDIATEVMVYSARPVEYILPADNNPLLPKSYSPWRQANLHGSNFTESTLYVGITVLALAILAWVLFVQRKLRALRFRGIPLVFLLGVTSFTLLAAFLLSLQPTITVFGHKLPMPSYILSHVTAMWRVYARIYLIVDLCLVLLASIGLYLLIAKQTRWKQIALVVVAIGIAGIELLTQSRGVTWDYKSSPAVYSWLKTQQSVDTIAEYPLSEQPSWPAITYLTYQQVHGKALLNSSRTDSPERPLRLSIQGLNDAQTVPILRTLGVDMVLSHDRPAKNVKGLQFVRFDASVDGKDKVWTYRILPGQQAAYALIASDGFHLPEFNKTTDQAFIPMGSHGVLGFRGLTAAAAKNTHSVRVSLSALPAKDAPKTQLITFSQQGVVRWQGVVDTETTVSFDADPTIPVDVMPYKPTTDTTIELYNLSASLQ